jgi:hypothetical protein
MLTDTIRAKGHSNIKATHKTTLQITTDNQISKRADCVIAVSADKSLSDLSNEIKTALQVNAAKIRLTIWAGNESVEITGFGSVDLTHSDTKDMVVRKSSFVSGRTLMIGANKAAADLDRKFVEKLKKPEDIIILIETDL